ncbi:MAG: response regulator [Bacteroidia bacterium]
MSTLKKILLVEDDEFDAEMTQRELRSIPLANEIIWLNTGEALLNYLAEFGVSNIALTILDIHMPRVNGIEALEKIRELKYDYFPIVVLSSSQEDPDIKRCYELNVNSFVTKPVKTEEFRKAVRTLGLYWGILNIPPLHD